MCDLNTEALEDTDTLNITYKISGDVIKEGTGIHKSELPFVLDDSDFKKENFKLSYNKMVMEIML